MARIEKVNAELIPMALELRREMLGVIYERDEKSFEGEFSDLTKDFFKSGIRLQFSRLMGKIP